MMQAKKPIGMIRNKTYLLVKYKEEQQEKQKRQNVNTPNQRFKKQGDLQLARKIQNFIKKEAKQKYLLSGNAETKSAESTSSNYSIELGNRAHQPQWAGLFDDTVDKMKQVQDISSEIQKLGAKRVRMTFGDTTGLEKQIYELNSNATQKIMVCERNIESISNVDIEETYEEKKIRKNMQRSLACQLQETATALRNQQKRMVTILNQVNKDDGGTFLKLSAQKESEMDAGQQLTQAEQAVYEDVVNERDDEINKLVEMVNGLAQVFKSLNQLVIDQGTLLDRIDYNIDQTIHNVKKANVKLREADTYQNSPLAKRCIGILLFLIFVFCVILTFKYSK